MPMGFIQSELDLKLLVLYIMSRVAGPVTFLQLLELALCDEGVDYFDFAECLSDLNKILPEMLDVLNAIELSKVRVNLVAVRNRVDELIGEIDDRS